MTRTRTRQAPLSSYSDGSRAGHPRTAGIRRRWARLQEAVSTQLWPTPLAAIFIAVVAGILLPLLDARVDEELPESIRVLLFNGGPDSARAVLSTIAGSLITATSLTFSLTVLALQLASSQASPRLLRMFSSDSMVHATLATFLATFAFSLLVLRTVQNSTDSTAAAVPSISITVCILLTLASVVMLTVFLAHLAKQLRVETMLLRVHRETRRTLVLVESTTPDGPEVIPAGTRPTTVNTVLAERSGFLTSASRRAVVALASRFDIVVEEEHSLGSSVISGVPLVSWWSRSDTVPTDAHGEELDHDAFERTVRSAYPTTYERTSSQDIGFGLRQLVDIAVRALSPGVNDPTTAVHALSHVSAVLCRIAKLPPQPAGLLDNDGELRLIVRPHSFSNLLNLGMEQPRRYGASDPQVVARLFLMLREVALNTEDSGRLASIAMQRSRLIASIAEEDFDPIERATFVELIEAVDAALAREAVVDEVDAALAEK